MSDFSIPPSLHREPRKSSHTHSVPHPTHSSPSTHTALRPTTASTASTPATRSQSRSDASLVRFFVQRVRAVLPSPHLSLPTPPVSLPTSFFRSPAGEKEGQSVQVQQQQHGHQVEHLGQPDVYDSKYRSERMKLLYRRMDEAETWREWEAVALELDHWEGNGAWKADPCSGEYNPQLLAARLAALQTARASGSVREMMHVLRTGLSRDLAGMGNVDLYRHAYVGTKKLIEAYVETAIQTIETVVRLCDPAPNHHTKSTPHDTTTKSQYPSKPGEDPKSSGRPSNDPSSSVDSSSPRELLNEMLLSRQSYGRSALLLSGGGTLGMLHIGVLKTLYEAKLLPRIISGASAGSIVCAVLCTRTDDEIPEVLAGFPYGNLNVFGDDDDDFDHDHHDHDRDTRRTGRHTRGWLRHVIRLLTEGSWSDIRSLTTVMREILGDLTFQEAYNRTQRILNICVSTEAVYELPRLLNYVTAPNVMIWSAVAASCSLPFVFSPASLLVKDPATGQHMPWNCSPQKWIDGSVDNDLPMTRLAEMFNVNHFIVSQVNPHIVPFLAKDDHLVPDPARADQPPLSSTPSSSAAVPVTSHPPSRPGQTLSHVNEQQQQQQQQQQQNPSRSWLHTAMDLAKEEALHRLRFLAEVGILPNLVTKMQSILGQKYSGDITILPAASIHDLPRLMMNPTVDFMIRACLAGERATWPKLSRIRDRLAIELALDRAVHALRERVVFADDAFRFLRPPLWNRVISWHPSDPKASVHHNHHLHPHYPHHHHPHQPHSCHPPLHHHHHHHQSTHHHHHETPTYVSPSFGSRLFAKSSHPNLSTIARQDTPPSTTAYSHSHRHALSTGGHGLAFGGGSGLYVGVEKRRRRGSGGSEVLARRRWETAREVEAEESDDWMDFDSDADDTLDPHEHLFFARDHFTAPSNLHNSLPPDITLVSPPSTLSSPSNSLRPPPSSSSSGPSAQGGLSGHPLPADHRRSLRRKSKSHQGLSEFSRPAWSDPSTPMSSQNTHNTRNSLFLTSRNPSTLAQGGRSSLSPTDPSPASALASPTAVSFTSSPPPDSPMFQDAPMYQDSPLAHTPTAHVVTSHSPIPPSSSRKSSTSTAHTGSYTSTNSSCPPSTTTTATSAGTTTHPDTFTHPTKTSSSSSLFLDLARSLHSPRAQALLSSGDSSSVAGSLFSPPAGADDDDLDAQEMDIHTGLTFATAGCERKEPSPQNTIAKATKSVSPALGPRSWLEDDEDDEDGSYFGLEA